MKDSLSHFGVLPKRLSNVACQDSKVVEEGKKACQTLHHGVLTAVVTSRIFTLLQLKYIVREEWL